MKILLVTHIYPPAIDGGSRVIYKLGSYLHRQKHSLLVLTTNATSTDAFVNFRLKTASSKSDSIVHRLPFYRFTSRPLRLYARLFKSDLAAVFSKGPFYKFFPFLSFLVTALRFQPDLIISGPLPTTSVLYAKFIKNFLNLFGVKTKLLINASFHPTDTDFFKKPLISALKSADYLWTLTDFETNYFADMFQIPTSKMINIGNGIDKTLLIKNFKPARPAGGLKIHRIFYSWALLPLTKAYQL